MDFGLIIAVATMGGLGFFFAGALAVADRKLRVEEDPRIAEVNEQLPGANCGACGNAGCYDFAVNVVDGTVSVTGCPVGGQPVADEIARVLGVEAGSAVKMVARVLCRGGAAEAAQKLIEYSGPGTCATTAMLAGGDKQCLYGCLGGGDCVEACSFGALVLNANGLPEVIDELCTGCGQCVTACPRDVIEVHPADRNIFVFCRNHDDPKTSKKVCTVACLGCGICARVSEAGVHMDKHLAVIDYYKIDPDKIPFEKCSTKAIDRLSVN